SPLHGECRRFDPVSTHHYNQQFTVASRSLMACQQRCDSRRSELILEALSGQCRGACRASPEEGALLEGIGQLEELCFTEGPAKKLYADGNTDGSTVGGGREPAWYRDGRQSSARRHEAIAFELHCIRACRHHEPALVSVEKGIESVAIHCGDQCISEGDLPAEACYVLWMPANSVSLLEAEPERFVR